MIRGIWPSITSMLSLRDRSRTEPDLGRADAGADLTRHDQQARIPPQARGCHRRRPGEGKCFGVSARNGVVAEHVPGKSRVGIKRVVETGLDVLPLLGV